MPEDIKPNATSTFYNTKIPSLGDDADIQEALRMYHYGTDGRIPNDSDIPIAAQSIAAYLKGLQDQIDDFSIGSVYTSSEPLDVEDGYIWVDADSAAPIFGTPPATIPSVARYQTSTPSNPVTGTLWVDSTNANALVLKVYDGTTWKVIS